VSLAVLLISPSCGLITGPGPGLNIVASISQQSAESMTFRIGVENTGSEAETLNFGNSQFFDIEVRSASGALVWRWSTGKSFLDVLWSLDLDPGESSVQETAWDLTGDNGQPLPHGTYTAKIFITSQPRDGDLVSVIFPNI
jgi:hypothetical protein